MSNKAVIVVPGSFNPITNAHVAMIESVKKYYFRLYDYIEIIILPTSDRCFHTEWKDYPIGDILPEFPRYILCRQVFNKIIEKYSYTYTSSCAISSFNKNTYNHINIIKRRYEDEKIDVIICLGADNIAQIDTWTDWESLVSENKFFVPTRGDNYTLPERVKPYADNFTFYDFDYEGISSTKVREAYKAGRLEEVKDMIPKQVYEYLEENENVYF